MARISKTKTSLLGSLLMPKKPAPFYKFRVAHLERGDTTYIADSFKIEGDFIVFYISSLPVEALRSTKVLRVYIIAEGTLEELTDAADDSA
jgi:hypothetical protein